VATLSVPTPVPGATVPPALTQTGPPTVPVPPSVPESGTPVPTVTTPVPVALPAVLVTRRVPTVTAVPPT
jgi:hypothetical protein